LNNSKTISGGYFGVLNGDVYSSDVGHSSTIGTLNNSGTISGGYFGILNGGYDSNNGGSKTIGTLNNSGTISGGEYGIANVGTIGTLNNSGTISGSYAIYNTSNATLGTVTNSGIIAGQIRNDSNNALIINGGSGSTFGLLTGSSVLDPKTNRYGAGANNIGLISNAGSNLIFASGNQLLNDDIVVNNNNANNDFMVNDNVVNHVVFNSGSALQVNNSITITGDYHQGANASLILGVGSNPVTTTGVVGKSDGYGRLVVSGSANIDSGSTVGLKQLGTYGFAQGQRYVVIQANTTDTHYNASSLHYTAAGYNVAGSSVVDNKAGTTDLLLTVGSAIPVIVPVTPPETTPTSYAPINRATSTDEHATLA